MPPATYKDLCVDAADPVRLGRFCSAVLGWRLTEHDDGDADLRDAGGRVQVRLNRVPEPKSVRNRNRVHVDVLSDDVDGLVRRGARVLRPKGDDGLARHVLADPDGNDFCVVDRPVP